jgi:hypothetical protein
MVVGVGFEPIKPIVGRLMVCSDVSKLLNKMAASQIAELSNLSKPYISPVKKRKHTPSSKLLLSLMDYHYTINKGPSAANKHSGLDLCLKIGGK